MCKRASSAVHLRAGSNASIRCNRSMASSDTSPDNRFTTFPACIFNSIDEWGFPVVEITGNQLLLNEVKQKSSERWVEYKSAHSSGNFLEVRTPVVTRHTLNVFPAGRANYIKGHIQLQLTIKYRTQKLCKMWPACLLLCISNGKDGRLVSCCEVLEVQETFTGTTCSSGQHETSSTMDQTKEKEEGCTCSCNSEVASSV